MSQFGSDEEIVELYKSGDQAALKKLIDRYTAPLYNFAARLTDKDNAPDIVSEIFIKVWKKINYFDSSKASFKTWIFTIAKNTAIDFGRRKKALLFSEIENENDRLGSFEDNIPDKNILPDSALQQLEDKEFLMKTLKKLSLEENEILVLHYQEEMTFDEISHILGKSLNTVKSKHRRALIKLKKILA